MRELYVNSLISLILLFIVGMAGFYDFILLYPIMYIGIPIWLVQNKVSFSNIFNITASFVAPLFFIFFQSNNLFNIDNDIAFKIGTLLFLFACLIWGVSLIKNAPYNEE